MDVMNIDKRIIQKVIELSRRCSAEKDLFMVKYHSKGIDRMQIDAVEYARDSENCSQHKQNLVDFLNGQNLDELHCLFSLMFIGWYDKEKAEYIGAIMIKACRDYLFCPQTPAHKKETAVNLLVLNDNLAEHLEEGYSKMGFIL